LQITIDLPDEIASTIKAKWDNFPRKVLESLAIEAYRQGVITSAEVGRMLNISSRYEVDSFLKQAQAYLHYNEADFEQDLLTMQKIETQRKAEM
jgi:predicted HTH domain antitoxin